MRTFRTSLLLTPLFVLTMVFGFGQLVHAQSAAPGGNPSVNTAAPGGNPSVNTAAPGGNPSDSCGHSNGTLQNPLKNICSLTGLFMAILDGIIQLASIALVVALVWVGFLFVQAQGAPGEITKARKALQYTIIGGLIVLGAKAILVVVQSTVNAL